MLNKKGFLFVVTVFLILTYILLSISVWVKGIETSERAYAEFYKESTVELAIEQITPAKMVEVSDVVMNRALFKLNEHTIESPVTADGTDENENIRKAFEELLVNGSADSAYFKGPGIEDSENSSLSDWASNLNASLLAIGVYVSDFSVTDFKIRQSDVNELNYSFDLTLQLRDYANTSSVSRKYEDLGNTLDVSGLVDPALARKSNQTMYRQFFFDKDRFPTAGSIEIINKGAGKGGQGWLYGPLASATSGAIDVPSYDLIASAEDRRNYILVGNFTEIEALGPAIYREFGGYILTNRHTVTPVDDCGGEQSDTFNPVEFSDPPECVPDIGSPEVEKPFIVAPGFNVGSAPECPALDGTGNLRCVLFINPYLHSQISNDPELRAEEGGGIYDVEAIRDFVMCGYYTHNPKAPSYLQRLLEDPYSRNSSQFGIETFVIGEYASDDIYHLRSRLDRELFNGSIQGYRVRGLPGCKDFGMCADEPVTGVFAASSDAIDDYNLVDIDCRTGAGCRR